MPVNKTISVKSSSTEPVQVSWALTEESTRNREIKGLLKACAYCKVTEAWIITAEEEEELVIDNVHIIIKLAWKWMIKL